MSEILQPKQERSLGELLGDLTREITTLVRQEMALAKAEMSQKAAKVGKDVGFIAAGGLVAYAGLLALVAALILGLWWQRLACRRGRPPCWWVCLSLRVVASWCGTGSTP